MIKRTAKKLVLAVTFMVVSLTSMMVFKDIRANQAFVKAVEEQLRLDSEYRAWVIKAGQEFDDCLAKGGEYIEGADMVVYKCFDERMYYGSAEEYAGRKK